MSFLNRARVYNCSEAGMKYPDSQFMISERWASATWILGNNYKSLSARGENDQPYYGSYPPGYLKRIWPMFTDATRILHLFSGSLTKEAGDPPWSAKFVHPYERVLRLDSRPEMKPDMVRDAEHFVNVWDINDEWQILPGVLDLILADPPYSVEDATRYGPCLCNKKKVLEQCHLALKPGGVLAWMDQSLPQFRKIDWNWKGVITMIRSTNHRVRCVFFFEKI